MHTNRLGLVMVALVMSLAGALFVPTDASACSCRPYSIQSIFPAWGTKDVSVHANIIIWVQGERGAELERKGIHEYTLHRVRGDYLEEIPFRAELIERFVRLIPSEPLAANNWYRVGNRFFPDEVLTKFRTGAETELPEPMATPIMDEVETLESRPFFFDCAGRSRSALLRLRGDVADTDSPSLFYWLVERRTPVGWEPFEAFAMRVSKWDAGEGRTVLKPRSVLFVGRSQCADGPELEAGRNELRLVLVRVDGKRWTGGAFYVSPGH